MNNNCSNNFAPAAVSLNYSCPNTLSCQANTAEFTNQIPSCSFASDCLSNGCTCSNGCAGTASAFSNCGCSACSANGCSRTAFEPAFLSAFTTTPRFHVQGCPTVFDRLDSAPQGISINCEGTVFTVAATGMYRIFYTAQTTLTSETLFRISVNGNAQAGTEVRACAGAQTVSAEAILPINACDKITLNVLSDNTALLRSVSITLVRVA